MAPSGTASPQGLIAQAAEQLSLAISESGQGPNDFARALLDLMEVSAKVVEFDEMQAAASVEAKSDEAKQWQEISLLTLKYCRQSLIEQQQRSIKAVSDMAEQGASLYKNLEPTAEAPTLAFCASPPGVWAARPPPGLCPPPGISGPPGLEVCTKARVQLAKGAGEAPSDIPKLQSKSAAEPKRTALPPWRKEKKVSAKEQEPAAMVGLALNLDAYSDGSVES